LQAVAVLLLFPPFSSLYRKAHVVTRSFLLVCHSVIEEFSLRLNHPQLDLAPLDREELAALFINLYNALIVHALVVCGRPANTAQRAKFFQQEAAYCVAGRVYTGRWVVVGVRVCCSAVT
jgi:hypothetical protein